MPRIVQGQWGANELAKHCEETQTQFVAGKFLRTQFLNKVLKLTQKIKLKK